MYNVYIIDEFFKTSCQCCYWCLEFFSKNDSGNIHIPVVAQLEDKVNQYVENKVELKELQEDGMPDVNRERKKKI